MKKLGTFTIILLSSVLISCGEKNRSGNEEIKIIQNFVVTGKHDGRKLLNKPDRTTVAIAKGPALHTVCSGTTIGISHVITAAHCVYDTKTKKLKKDLTVVPSYHMAANQKPSPRFFISKVFILKDYIQDLELNGYTSYAASKDIAILQVLEFNSTGYFYDDHSHKVKMVDNSQFDLKGEPLSLIGYTGGGNGTLDNSQYVQHKTCETKGQRYQYSAIHHDCDTTPGSSGMGLIAEDSEGHGVLIGVHTGHSGSDKELNSGAYLKTDVLEEIQNEITLFKHDNLEKFETFDYHENTGDELYVGYQFRNNCSEKVSLSIYFKYMDGEFYVKGPMEIEPGELKIFNSKTKDIRIKYHAKLSNGQIINRNDVRYIINDNSMSFESLKFDDKFTDNELVLCL